MVHRPITLNYTTHTYNYVIPMINTKITHLFLLACTFTRVLNNTEQTQHTLTVYGGIKQPAIWYSWVITKTNGFEDGSITICYNFMNQAVIKCANISSAQEGNSLAQEKLSPRTLSA